MSFADLKVKIQKLLGQKPTLTTANASDADADHECECCKSDQNGNFCACGNEVCVCHPKEEVSESDSGGCCGGSCNCSH